MKNDIAMLKRDSTKITISEFFERFNLGKYNFNPRYQRRSDVWDVEKQSFLLDSILKNYPLPPIFLHQRIDEETGATKYDVIDGKQRLTAIIRFLKNEISLPQDFDEGPFGNSNLNGIFFQNLEGDLGEYKKQLWRYTLTVEYIDTDELEIIDNVFDRLNRNGEPLEMQELRKAKYHDTLLMDLVEKATQLINWDNLGKIKFNRMQDQEFVSELLFYLLENEASDGDAKMNLDVKYKTWNARLDQKISNNCINEFKQIVGFINKLDLDFDKYKIKGVSHFYALFAFSKTCVLENRDSSEVSIKLNEFFAKVRSKDDDDVYINDYRISMQSNTRSKSQRKKRINALVNFVNG